MTSSDSSVQLSTASLLIVGSDERDHAVIRSIWPHSRIYSAYSLQEAHNVLQKHLIDLVLSDKDLPDGNWRDLVSSIGIPTVVFAKDPDERFWAEVLNEGGDDLVAKPFDLTDLERVVDGAIARSLRRSSQRAYAGLTTTFDPRLSAEQVTAVLTALADFYRACGGVGFEIDFDLTHIIGEPAYHVA